MGPPTATWHEALGGNRLLVSGFGKWGGGIYDLTTGMPEALDDLATSGVALGGGRLWRALRAPGEQTSTCELLSYDARGVRSYQRLDAIRDPHDVCWHDGAVHVSSSWDDAVWRVAGGMAEPVWRARADTDAGDADADAGEAGDDEGGDGGTVPDAWHVNSLLVVDGALHVCAFGRFERHKAWKTARRKDVGFVLDLRTGRDVLAGLTHPHAPRRRDDLWYVCESTPGRLTELDLAGRVRRRLPVRRFTRGLALLGGSPGGWALVGGNAHRDHDEDRAEVVVVDLGSFEIVERIPLPCLEVYDIVPVPAALARGVALGFGSNAARAVEQHRSSRRPAERRPTDPEVAVRLATPRAAREAAVMGRVLDPADARHCGVQGSLPAEMAAGTVRTVTFDVVNRSSRAIGTVLPRPVKLAARWYPIAVGQRGKPVANPRVPLPRVVSAGAQTPVDVPLEVPGEPGLYEVWVALHQPRLGWFGARVQSEVTVVAPATPSSPLLAAERGEEHDVADAVGVGEQHDQPVHADAQPAGGR
jgi:hypothetical protein